MPGVTSVVQSIELLLAVSAADNAVTLPLSSVDSKSNTTTASFTSPTAAAHSSADGVADASDVSSVGVVTAKRGASTGEYVKTLGVGDVGVVNADIGVVVVGADIAASASASLAVLLLER